MLLLKQKTKQNKKKNKKNKKQNNNNKKTGAFFGTDTTI